MKSLVKKKRLADNINYPKYFLSFSHERCTVMSNDIVHRREEPVKFLYSLRHINLHLRYGKS